MRKAFMIELKGISRGAWAAVSAELQAAYESAISCRGEESEIDRKMSSKKEAVSACDAIVASRVRAWPRTLPGAWRIQMPWGEAHRDGRHAVRP